MPPRQPPKPSPSFLDALGRILRQRRQDRGLTVSELAEATGISRRFLTLLESGRGNVSIVNLQHVANALGARLSEIIAEVEGRPAVRHVALLGLRGAGKSTIGARAARQADVTFVELDGMVESAAGLALAEIFAVHGESYFRRIEREALERLLGSDNRAVIATGGGIVASPDTFALLRKRCTTVWLKASPEDHWNRVVAQGDRRPIESRPNAMAELRSILSARAPLYSRAEHVIDTTRLGLEAAVADLTEIIRDVPGARRAATGP